MIKLVHAFCIAVMLAASSTAGADDEITCKTQKGKNLWIAGGKAYNLQKYDDAIAHWEAAYLECEDPGLLFNIAQANRKANNYQRARDLYAAWLRDPKTQNDPDRELVKLNIAELDELIEKQKQSVNSPPDGMKPKNGTDGITAGERNDLTGGGPTPRETERGPRWYSDTLGWAILGTGVAIVAVGGALILYGNALRDDAARALDEADVTSIDDSASSYQVIGSVAMGAGVAVAAVGVVRLILHDPKPDPPVTRRDATRVDVGIGWVSISGSF
jgi:tetratricopeptide (TPR) repeat protein